jgi:hypothetical protein
MTTIFDKKVKEAVIARIRSLNPNSQPLWGKMRVAQMVRHCALCEAYYQGRFDVKRSMLGRVFGKLALKGLLKDGKPGLRKNSPTPAAFLVEGDVGSLEVEKEKWIALIMQYDNFPVDHFVHWFFGKMTQEEIGQFVYRHTDHHLRQFSV